MTSLMLSFSLACLKGWDCKLSGSVLWRGDFWRRPNGSVASERQTAAISRRRVVFIVQLEAGRSTCNHLLQVWASSGAPSMGSQSSVVRDELFDLHIVWEQETPGASPALRLYLSAKSAQGDLLHLVHWESHIQRCATWRRLPVHDGCSRSHESCDLFVAASDGDRVALFCEERLISHKLIFSFSSQHCCQTEKQIWQYNLLGTVLCWHTRGENKHCTAYVLRLILSP